MMSQARAWGNEVFATILLLKGSKCLWGYQDDCYNPNLVLYRCWRCFSWLWWLVYLVIQLVAFPIYSYGFSRLLSDSFVGAYDPSAFWWGRLLLGCLVGTIGGVLLGIVFAFCNLFLLYAGQPIRALFGDKYDPLEYGDTFWTRPFDVLIRVASRRNHGVSHPYRIRESKPIALKLAVVVSTLLSRDRAEEWLGDTHEMVTTFQKNPNYDARLLWRLALDALILLRCFLILKAIILSNNLDDLLPRKKK